MGNELKRPNAVGVCREFWMATYAGMYAHRLPIKAELSHNGWMENWWNIKVFVHDTLVWNSLDSRPLNSSSTQNDIKLRRIDIQLSISFLWAVCTVWLSIVHCCRIFTRFFLHVSHVWHEPNTIGKKRLNRGDLLTCIQSILLQCTGSDGERFNALVCARNLI